MAKRMLLRVQVISADGDQHRLLAASRRGALLTGTIRCRASQSALEQLAGVNLTNANLTGANLVWAVFQSVTLTGADFNGATGCSKVTGSPHSPTLHHLAPTHSHPPADRRASGLAQGTPSRISAYLFKR